MLSAGTKIGTYEIVAEIGKGGMGEVYRARDTNLGRDVATKVLPDSFARDGERLARFQREAKVLASLNHPNIASIYGIEMSGDSRALIMELVEGPTLADRIAQGPIAVDEALRIARQIADALEYAHERGIVHRDLKPANVKVTNEDAVKILDFGLAKAIEGDPSSMDMSNSPTLTHMATQAGVLLGTAAYMSPEQAKAKPVDRRADIWAFGCVLYEMLTGNQPFRGESVIDTLAVVTKEEPDWSLLPKDTPARVKVLLQRCLQKDPKQRLQAIGDARISLDEVLSGAPEVSSSAGVSPANFPLWRRTLPWAIAALTFIALAPLAFLYFREKPTVPAGLVRFEIPVPAKLAADGSFAVSPDGRELAYFAAGADGVTRIYLRALNSLDARLLPGTESTAEDPMLWWSPDARRIEFSTSGKIEAIDLASGAVDTLGETQLFVAGGSRNRDGELIFGEYPGPLMRVLTGGTVSPLTALDSSRNEAAHFLPSFLPDGRHFIYLRFSFHIANSGIYVGSLDAKPENQNLERLVETPFGASYVPSSSDPNAGYLLFLTGGAAAEAGGGTLMAQSFDARRLRLTGEPVQVAQRVGMFSVFGFFSAAADTLIYREAVGGDYRLTWYDRQGKAVGTVGEPGPYGQVVISPNGSRAVIVRPDSRGNLTLWMTDFSQKTTTRFTFDSSRGGVGDQAVWSADGKSVFFVSNPDGPYDLYEKPADGEASERLVLKSNEDKAPLDVSRGGRFLLYNSRDPETKEDLWILPLQGDRKPFPFLRTPFNDDDGRFSPDGHWVAYESDESGSTEVYVRPFSPDSSATDASGGGAKWQISYGGGEAPRWSKDGKELYYLTPDWKVMAVAITTSPSFQAGTPKLLFQAPQQHSNWPMDDYTIDGKRFLFFTAAESGSQAQTPFDVVLNWQDILKQTQ